MSESKTAFIYIRRSSEKNKLTSISIDKQIEETQKECIKKGFKILNIFIDNKSRFIAGKRDNFDKMLKDLKERNIKGKGEKVDYIVVYMASRLSRNYLEASIISELVLSGNINIVSIKEGIDCSNLKGKKSAISIMNEAVFDNIEKSIEGVRNMNERYKRGYLPKQLPIGYKQIGYGDKRKYVTDTENDTDKNVIKIFELYSTGKYSYKSLSNKLKNEGIIRKQRNGKETLFHPNNIEQIVLSGFYCGDVKVTYKNVSEDNIEYLKDNEKIKINGKNIIVDYSDTFDRLGTYTPLISKRLYEKCKEVRERRNFKKIDDESNCEIYPYKGVLYCPCKNHKNTKFIETYKSLRLFTSEKKIKNNLKKYIYYRCTNNDKNICDNISTSANIIEKIVFNDVILKLIFDDSELKLLEGLIKNSFKNKGIIKDKLNKDLNEELLSLEKYREDTIKVYISSNDNIKNLLEDELLKTKIKIDEIKSKLNLNISSDEEINEDSRKIKDILNYAKVLIKDFLDFGDIKKRAVIGSLFEYIIFYKKELIDFELKPLFKGIYNRKVLTFVGDKKFLEKKKSNSKNKKEKPFLTSQSLKYVDGTPTVNRTQLAGFGVLNSNRGTMEV